ncbi:xenobiotic compound monooxygenase, DszA family [Lasiosphaeris hirsuta]|uniref:Xenobiotic compound monooxygenase, DszA family n=1 Tax=Lasiosphaeris hirsuta TaxID=260670 RepID=A0AA40AYU7_9PEZI|nr:xenobiotic compound monooxygenase, DszA family [Lasiosphaeris hirsuta]
MAKTQTAAAKTKGATNATHDLRNGQKHILINAFDMPTVGHLSPGQWKNPKDKSATKRKLNINVLFFADTYGGYNTYENSLDKYIQHAAQWPITDPTIPISAMAAVTKNLTFAITVSTSFEPPFFLAKRFSTLNYLTDGPFKAIGLDNPIEYDERYRQADEYLRTLYKLWEGSWADDALNPDPENDSYVDPDKVRTINHQGKYFTLNTKYIVDPTSSAGFAFASTHAEAIFVSSHSPQVLAPKIANIRRLIFATFTPIVGRTDEEARAKYAELRSYASVIGGLIPLDQEITAADSLEAYKVRSILDSFTTTTTDIPKWTPRIVAEAAAIGGLGPVSVGSPQTVADKLERWVREADLDGFNIGYVTTPGTFEDLVDLLIPKLRKRGTYPELPAEDAEPLTAREKVYGKGQSGLRADHEGSTYKYDVYKEDPPYVPEEAAAIEASVESQ